MAHVVYRAMNGTAPSVGTSNDASALFSRARRMLPPLDGTNELNPGRLPTREHCEYLQVLRKMVYNLQHCTQHLVQVHD